MIKGELKVKVRSGAH